jgi:ketosteroid isomerase-like protein
MRLASIAVFACLAMLAACRPSAVDTAPRTAEATIRARLDSTAIGWNRGELATYMMVYEPGASQMGARGVEHGRALIEEGMRKGFWRTGRPVQNLRYEDVEVRPLGEHYALVTGRFVLTGGGRPDRTGTFTTVWTDRTGTWMMIHDHSG